MAKPRLFTLTIVTKPYLAKFIYAKYGYPLIISNSSLFGIIVLSLLDRRVHTHQDIQQAHVAFKGFTSSITINIPYQHMKGFGVDMPDENIIHLNRYIDDQFEDELYGYVHQKIKDGRYKGYDKAIQQFCKDYGISLGIDASFEALKKCEYRFRLRREQYFTKAKNNEDIFPTSVPSDLVPVKNNFPTSVPSQNTFVQLDLFG